MKPSILKRKNFLLDLIFLLFLILAIFLRFYHFDQTYEWGADNIRDFLVAKHIVVHHDFKWIVPWAFGSSNNMVNSVFYFYFLAIFYFFSFGNVVLYQFLSMLFVFGSLAFFAYLLAKIFFKEIFPRYAMVLLFCFLPILNVYGRGAFQPHFVLPFLLMSVYFYFSAFRYKSLKHLSLATLFYIVTLNLHYSMLVILPWAVWMVFYLQYFIQKNQIGEEKSFKWKNLFLAQLNWPSLLLIFCFYFLVLNQLIVKGGVGGFYPLQFFLHKIFFINSQSYLSSLENNFHVFIEASTGLNNYFISLLLLYSSVFFIFILFFLRKKTFYSTSLFISLLCFPFVFLVSYGSANLNYPTYYFLPFYLLLPIFLLSVLASLSKNWRMILFSILFLSTFIIYLQQFKQIISINNQEQIKQPELIAALIAEDAKKNLMDERDFFIFTIDDQLDWSSPKYWYYLENYLDTKLVETTSYRYNVVSAKKESKTTYLVCDSPRVRWDIGRENWCLERLEGKQIFNSQTEIFRDEQKNIFIYRLTSYQAVDRYSIYRLIGGKPFYY